MSGRSHFANNTLEHLEASAQKLLLLRPVFSATLGTRIPAHHLLCQCSPLYEVGALPPLPEDSPVLFQVLLILALALEAAL